jgi:hypothetical protein
MAFLLVEHPAYIVLSDIMLRQGSCKTRDL